MNREPINDNHYQDGDEYWIMFEGTVEGRKRVGHLWEPQHGKVEPLLSKV